MIFIKTDIDMNQGDPDPDQIDFMAHLPMPKSCSECAYRPGCIVGELPEDSLRAFSDSLKRYSISGKGKAIFNQGGPVDGCYFLCNGLVKLVKVLENGDEVILDVLAPFSVIGSGDDKETPSRAYSALTISELTELAYLKEEQLLSFAGSHPRLGEALLRNLAHRLEDSYGLLACMKLPVRERILSLLDHIARYSKREDRTGHLRISLSQFELAQITQTTPETVSRVLRRLRQQGIVNVSKKGIIVKPEALEERFGQGKSSRKRR